jgi:diaminopimelate dehydrogenase
MNAAAKQTLAIISTGWDPGLFSLMRLQMGAVLPAGQPSSFWGPGVSQGHGDALRRIPGVKNAVQYTHPIPAAVKRVQAGEAPLLTTREKHARICYVAAEEAADTKKIEHDIITMPHYFADYDTTVHFVTAEELARDHGTLPHGGMVIHSAPCPSGTQVQQFSLQLASNPHFTASVMIAYARAAYRLHQRGETGARTVFDIPPVLLHPGSPADLMRDML